MLSGAEESLRGQPGPQTAPQTMWKIESPLVLNYLFKLMMDFQIIPFTYQSFVVSFFKRHLCTPLFYFIPCSRCHFHFQTFPQNWESVWRTKCCSHSGRWPILIAIWKEQQKKGNAGFGEWCPIIETKFSTWTQCASMDVHMEICAVNPMKTISGFQFKSSAMKPVIVRYLPKTY